ncbi:MAG: polysaccharide deacetylase family protein [Bacillota bacterium]|nr:polysaccharide deacetylase family protein [Bacillota bacterium]
MMFKRRLAAAIVIGWYMAVICFWAFGHTATVALAGPAAPAEPAEFAADLPQLHQRQLLLEQAARQAAADMAARDAYAAAHPPAPCLALTFDDGPSETVTPLLLDLLYQRGVKATFFMLGVNAAAYPETVMRAAAEGHQICSHGWDHRYKFTRMDERQLSEELQRTDQQILAACGVTPLYVRPPYGAINDDVAEMIGRPVMMWSIDPRDWQYRDADRVARHIVDHAADGAIVICHDLYPSTAQGVAQAVDTLLERGWEFVTLEELYHRRGLELRDGVIYYGKQGSR